MNSGLQCLSQTQNLTDYFLDRDNGNKIINNNCKNEEYQLVPTILGLIKYLWNASSSKPFSPNDFKCYIVIYI